MARSKTSLLRRLGHMLYAGESVRLDAARGVLTHREPAQRRSPSRAPHAMPQPGVGGVVAGLVLGALCLMGARYLRYTQLGLHDAAAEADVLLTIDIGLAAAVVFVVGGVVRQTTARHMAAQAAGIALMVSMMHNLVWAFPNEFAQLYSPQYVDQVRAVTAPHPLLESGFSIRL